MSQDNGDIFTRIRPEESLRLFQDLAAARGELNCKGEAESIYRLIAEKATPKMDLFCSLNGNSAKPQGEKEILANFFLGGERYFFKSTVRYDKDLVVLNMNAEVFHLQRRQNYRIKIPESYQAAFTILLHNKTPLQLRSQVLDLSSGGCRISLPGDLPIFTTNDVIEGEISLGRREPLDVTAIVRHYKNEKVGGANKQIFGVEFKDLTSQIEGRIFAITMDLHREFFSRINTKV